MRTSDRYCSRTPIAAAVAAILYVNHGTAAYAIAAVTSRTIEDLHLNKIDDLTQWVPGVSIKDQGPWGPSSVVIRGLNTNTLGESGGGHFVSAESAVVDSTDIGLGNGQKKIAICESRLRGDQLQAQAPGFLVMRCLQSRLSGLVKRGGINHSLRVAHPRSHRKLSGHECWGLYRNG